MCGLYPALVPAAAVIALPALDEHFTRSCDWHLVVGLAQPIAAARVGSAVLDRRLGR
jgi:hypothetical protein